MNTSIRKSEFGDVLKIGQTIGKKTYSKDDFYFNHDGKKELHLNKLAWESPSIWTDKNGEEHYGFVPDDPFYDEIIETFKSFPDVWRDNFYIIIKDKQHFRKHQVGTIVRKHWVGSDNYDIVIKWYSEPKMITWYFCKSYEYAV